MPRIDRNVRVVDVFPDNTHMPIVYPIALTAAAKADAIKFIDYVRGPAGMPRSRSTALRLCTRTEALGVPEDYNGFRPQKSTRKMP